MTSAAMLAARAEEAIPAATLALRAGEGMRATSCSAICFGGVL